MKKTAVGRRIYTRVVAVLAPLMRIGSSKKLSCLEPAQVDEFFSSCAKSAAAQALGL